MRGKDTWGAWISSKANKLAKELIIEFSIQPGCGISLFLDVNHAFDNHMAIRVWVQRMLDEGLDELSDPINVLSQQFIDCMPEYEGFNY